MQAPGTFKRSRIRSVAPRRPSLLMRRDGAVLIAVLWICALIMWFSLQISAENRIQGEEQVHGIRRSQALHLAVGGCYEALARMGLPASSVLDRKDRSEDEWLPDGRPHLIEYRTGHAIVFIEREDTKVNINKAGRDQVKALLERAGLEPDNADGLAGVVVDFIDKDDLPQLHGAEKDAYKQMGVRYSPFNGPLVRLEQMLLIPGITQQLFYGYGVEREGGEIDTPPELRDLNLPSVDSLFQMCTVYGSNTVLRDNTPLEELEAAARVAWTKGGIYRILSCGKSFNGPPSVIVWLVVRFSPDNKEGYQILYRKVL